jgi:hypothetical protein
LLRQLSANDPTVRSWLIKFAKGFNAEETRKKAAEQGLTINEAAPGRTLSLIDRMVAVLEVGQSLADHFTADELNSPADPEWTEFLAEMERRQNARVQHGCNYCSQPAIREITIGGRPVHFCDVHGQR